MNMAHNRLEQRLLKTSIAVTLFSSLLGIGFGLLISSKAIVFDGIYEVVDAAMTVTALIAVRLIARGDDDRFQYGYWHLEPILALINGMVLSLACIYALIDGIAGLISGVRTTQFDAALIFAAFSAALSFAMYGYIKSRSKELVSQLLTIDARAWLIGALLSLGLCVSFIAGRVLTNAGFAPLAGHVDSLVLIAMAIGLFPFPAKTIWRAARDILQIAPAELDLKVREVAERLAVAHGFVDHDSHVMSVGRARFIEIGFVAPSGEMTKSFAELDTIRGEIASALGGLSQGSWLTVDFTADKRWI